MDVFGIKLIASFFQNINLGIVIVFFRHFHKTFAVGGVTSLLVVIVAVVVPLLVVNMNTITTALDTFTPISLSEMDEVKLLDRMDLKFVFHIHQLPVVLSSAAEYYKALTIDNKRFARYETHYFDTDDYELYTLHHNGRENRHKVRMTGGTVVVQGSVTSSDDALVYRGVCNVNGGVLAVAGANLISPSASSAQRSVLLQVTSYIQAGGIVNIQDATGTSIVTFMAAKYAYYFLVSSPQIANGATCSVYFGGSVSGTSLNGYYPDGVYTTGTLKKSFTVSGIVTSVGI